MTFLPFFFLELVIKVKFAYLLRIYIYIYIKRAGGRAGFEAAEHQWKQLPRKEPQLFNQTFNTRKEMDIDKQVYHHHMRMNELATWKFRVGVGPYDHNSSSIQIYQRTRLINFPFKYFSKTFLTWLNIKLMGFFSVFDAQV